MSEAINQPEEGSPKESLRILLDDVAAKDCEWMESELKSQGSHIKLTSSKFISYLVKDYKNNYFSKNKKKLSKVFFDSKEFIAAELKKAQTPEAVEQILKMAMKNIAKGQASKKRKLIKNQNTNE